MVFDVNLGPGPPPKGVCAHMGTLWPSLHGILAWILLFIWSVWCHEPLPRSAATTVVLLLAFRKESLAQRLTIIQKNVVYYSCAEQCILALRGCWDGGNLLATAGSRSSPMGMLLIKRLACFAYVRLLLFSSATNH